LRSGSKMDYQPGVGEGEPTDDVVNEVEYGDPENTTEPSDVVA